jgi:MtN3 and saliva related transmembrane protein
MLVQAIEVLFSLGLFVNAALFVPQIVKLYHTKNTEGLSLITFVGFNLIQLLAILHGVIHHDPVLITGFCLSLFSCGTVTLLLIWYRIKPSVV